MDLTALGPELVALGQVIMIDLVLAGDNAIVVGMAAAGLPKEQRGKVILIGIIAATILRIMFALVTTQLLLIIGLTLAGGLLLLWVCWKFWRELVHQRRERLRQAARSRQELTKDERRELRAGHAEKDLEAEEALEDRDLDQDGLIAEHAPRKTFAQAAWQIVVADVSMSLDNVLAVAGAAQDHPVILVFGLGLSIALMGIAASFIARLLQKHHWIAYVGLAVILYVAVEMIYRGALEVWPRLS